MMLYILWTISNIQGPGGAETLRFSNLPYQIDSGPSAGQSFQDSWSLESYERFSIKEVGFELTSEGVLVPGGVLEPAAAPVDVANNYTSAAAVARQLTYLFGADYDLTGADVVGEMARTKDGTVPPYSSFQTFFTGKVSKRPGKTVEEVSWVFESTLARLNGPMLSRRFDGMGPRLVFNASAPISEGDPAPMIGGNWTVQAYLSAFLGAFATGKQTIWRVEDSSNVALLDLYIDAGSDTVKLDVKWASGTDTYTLWARPVGKRDGDYYFWVSVSWNQSAGTYSVRADGGEVVTAGTILHNPAGTEAETIIGDLPLSAYHATATRLYNVALTDDEAAERERPLDYLEDEGILYNAWEFNDGRGSVVTDYGPRKNHLQIQDPIPDWRFYAFSGDAGFADKVIPAVLGAAFGVPAVISNPKEPSGALSVGMDSVQIVRAKSVPLSRAEQYPTGTYSFNHATGAIKLTSGVFTFGRTLLIGESLTVSGAFDSQYNGTYTVLSMSPSNVGVLRRQGLADRYGVIVESPGWTSSGTGSATIRADVDQQDWNVEPAAAPPEVGKITLSRTFPSPVHADIVGDPNIYATSAPSAYTPPDDLANVLLQAAKDFGPQFDNTTFPDVAYGLFTTPAGFAYRVGYYVADESPTRKVIDDIAKGCLVWMRESGAGVISVDAFKFPEEIGSSTPISADDVIPGTITNKRGSGSSSGRWITSLKTNYQRVWSTVGENDIPQIVDENTRSFVSREWRTAISGDAGNVTTETPTFYAYVNRKPQAKALGDRVLRLSQGEVVEFDVRVDGEDQPTTYTVGSKLSGDLSAVDLGASDRIVLGREMFLGAGYMTLTVWFEP